ncbi:MAG: Fic family protein [Tannerellaceae bacterium]
MKKITKLFEEWKALQPLKVEDQKRLDDKLNLEFNYNSNHIEGNTLTYGQTELLLKFGDISGGAKMRDLEEMKAHNVGLQWVKSLAKDEEFILTERDIKYLNEIILACDYYKINPKTGTQYKIHVGQYKTRQNSVITATGERFDYANPEETSAMMYDLVSWFNKEVESGELNPIELAALFHYRYIRIHPFEDGNGRIARLLVNYILLRFGYPMIIIKSEKKEEYLSVLHQCDIAVGLTPSDGATASLKDIQPFVEYLLKEVAWSLDLAIKAGRGQSIREDSDWKKKLLSFTNKLVDAPEWTNEQSTEVLMDFNMFMSYIDSELKAFYPMFEKVYKGVEDGYDSRAVINLEGNLHRFLFETVFSVKYFDILIKFYDYKYVVLLFEAERFVDSDFEVNEVETFTFRYDEKIGEDEKDKILNYIGNSLVSLLEASK